MQVVTLPRRGPTALWIACVSAYQQQASTPAQITTAPPIKKGGLTPLLSF
jgi:hypothetical protein